MKLRHCITLHKNTEKTILLYIAVTVNHRTYFGIDQCIKRKIFFVSSAAKMWKRRMFDMRDLFMFCFCIFCPDPISLSLQSQQGFLKLDFEA